LTIKLFVTFFIVQAIIEESLIKHVFGGVIRSSVHQKGKKESTTLQPFFTLQLDIQVFETSLFVFPYYFFINNQT